MRKVVIRPEIYSFNIDSSRHVSNIAYIQWLEIARIRLLEEIDLPVHEIEKRGFAPVLIRTEIDYRKPLYLGDKIRVEMDIAELKRISAVLSFTFFREPDEVVAVAKQTGLFFNLETKRPHRLSDEDWALFAPYVSAGETV